MNSDAYMLAWFMRRAPNCFCAGNPKMFVNEKALYECPECGHTVRLLAAGSRLEHLSEKDSSRLVPLPEQRPLNTGWVEPTPKPIEDDDVSF